LYPNILFTKKQRLDTQSLIANGSFPMGTNSDPTAACQVPTFMQYDPAAYKAFKKAYLQYIKHVASIENGGETPEKEVTSFLATDLEIDDRGMP